LHECTTIDTWAGVDLLIADKIRVLGVVLKRHLTFHKAIDTDDTDDITTCS